MYLKTIELENFKSFVHKNRIELKSGFTAVSGPNGSGKSNIGDAILFVLGPKSSKVIRANKLTDLIYDGGKTGKKANFCRVSLIFDNSDRVLPLDTGEVKLTRYIKRANTDEGYSSYFYINDEKARLQDFISLLEHAKINADGYNFVKQGDVTRIVEMGPVERRQILEDIAGISDFDRDIAKAEDKKRIVIDNIEKIEVLMNELKNRIETLERDRDVALRYKSLEDEMKETDAKIAYARFVRAREEMDAYGRQIDIYENTIKELTRTIEEREKEIENIKERKEEIDKKINELGGKELAELKNRIDSLKIEIAKINSRIDDRNENIKKNKNKINELKDNIKNITVKLAEMKKERDRKQNELAENRKSLKNTEIHLREKEHKVEHANQAFRKMNEDFNSLTVHVDQLKVEYNKKLIEYNKAKERWNLLAREIARKEEEKKEIDEGIRDAEWRIEEAKKKGKSAESARKNLNANYMEFKNRQTSLRKEIAEKQKQLEKLNAEYQRLKGKTESSNSHSAAVTAILRARDQGILNGIYGTIAELGRVDEKYELAIQIAAGGRLMSIVCERDDDAAKAIEYLKKNRLGRAIFLPLNKMRPHRPGGRAVLAARDQKSYGYAIELIKFDKKYEAAFWYVFGDTVVVDNLENARRLMGGVRLVTLDGQLIEASGAMVGGSISKRKNIAIGNMSEISNKLRTLRMEKESLEDELHHIESKIDEILKKISEIGQTSPEDIVIWNNEKNRLEGKLAKILMDIEKSENEKKGMEKIILELDSEIKNKSAEIDKLENQRDILRTKLDNMVSDEDTREIAKLREILDALRNRVESMDADVNSLDKKIGTLENELRSYNSRVHEINGEINEMEELNNKESTEMEEKNIEKRKYLEIVKHEESKIKDLIAESDTLLGKINEINNHIISLKGEIKVNEDLRISALTKQKESAEQYEEARKEYESCGIVLKRVESIKILKRHKSDLENRLQALGSVNMKSIEEYDEVVKRHGNLQKDYDSLIKEKHEIENLVKELGLKKKDGLMKVFDAINENMHSIYRELSNGGDAYLSLENNDDPFKGGLIIKVKPPGKGIKRLNSLSGGEKSLTALALIFAIQQYDPSPIYLLDEVDMFLDGVNAEMVGRIIKRNSTTAQFIVVSLRKTTIKFADYLIGVTHRKDGISRIYLQPALGEVTENA